MNSPPSPSPSTPSSGDASPAPVVADIPSATAASSAPAVPSPNNAKRRLPSSSVPYGAANRRRREDSVRDDKDKADRAADRERDRGELADVELMKWINSIVRDPFDDDVAVS
ncbi:hypothetical protein BDV93DRAFT_517663 [Ceratobasidium sp. AG-I]|nr:hypothetical protein BDV93DRAFT_517663 [Ceratobasidium sp. AG-I]